MADARIAALVGVARELAPLVRAHAEENERERRLAPAVVEALQQAALFHLLVPARFGGHGLDIVSGMAVVEEIAAADGSTGWNLSIGAVGATFAVMLDDESAIEEIVKTPRTIVAGSINPMAVRFSAADGGFRLRG